MPSDSTSHQIHDGLFQIGLRNRREMVGNAYVDTALQNGSSEIAYPGQQLVTESWDADRIKKLAGVGHSCPNNGLNEIEIRKAILHATIYCGVPAGVEAMKVAVRSTNDMIAKGEHKRQLAELSPSLKNS